MPTEKKAAKEPEGTTEGGERERPEFRPAQAIPPITLMGIFIVITVCLALIVGPLYNSYGLSSGFEEFAQSEHWYLYAFGFVALMVVVAVGILVLRKLLKKRKLKLKYLFALVVFTSTFVVVQPFIDVAFNGAPPVWKEFPYDIEGVEKAVPLDPADMGHGSIVMTNTSFHVLERRPYDHREIGSVDGIAQITDPHYDLGFWVISAIRGSDRIAWTIDRNGSIQDRGPILHPDTTLNFLGVNIANVNGTPYIVSLWRSENDWSIAMNSLSSDFKFQEIAHPIRTEGPLFPVTGWSFGGNYYHNGTHLFDMRFIQREGRVVTTGCSISDLSSIEWVKAEGDHALVCHEIFNLTGDGTGQKRIHVLSDIRTGSAFAGHVGSGYLCSCIIIPNEEGSDVGFRMRTVVISGSRLIIADQKDLIGDEYHLSSSDIVATYQESIDGNIWLVSSEGASYGLISTRDRGQVHIQIISFLIAGGLVAALLIKPKWWLVDIGGLLMGAGVIAIMGISFPILFTLLLLVLLAVYDFISVYKTKHMIALADSVVEAKMPILLVFPMKWSYRYEDEKNLMDPKRKRESLFMGLGDVIIPGIMILSIASFLSPIGGLRLFGFIYPPVAVAIFALLGMLAGWGALMFFVIKGKAHAGLPPINSGTILGFIIGHLIVYGTIVFW